MGLWGSIKSTITGIFKRKKTQESTIVETPKTVETPKLNVYAEEPRQVKEPQKIKQVRPQKAQTRQVPSVSPKVRKLRSMVREHTTKVNALGQQLPSNIGMSVINNINVKRQEYINSDNIRTNYRKILGGRVLGQDKKLMEDIINNREALLRHRLGATIKVIGTEGHIWVTFQIQGVLLEELGLIKDYVKSGDYITIDYHKKNKQEFWDNIWLGLRESLLANNVRSLGRADLQAFKDKNEFVVGNVEIDINYA